jgi:hypothetical protein
VLESSVMRLPKEFIDLFGKFGIDKKSLMKIRFGGVIGKQALVGISALAVFIVVALRTQNILLLWGCLVGTFLMAASAIVAIAIQGHKHPLEATLEGAEIVVMEHLRHEVAAKGIDADKIPPSPPVMEGIGKKELTEGKES